MSITKFARYAQHPGGEDLLLEYGGKDGTRAFNESGHSSSARSMMKPYKIGLLAQVNRILKNDLRQIKLELKVDYDSFQVEFN